MSKFKIALLFDFNFPDKKAACAIIGGYFISKKYYTNSNVKSSDVLVVTAMDSLFQHEPH